MARWWIAWEEELIEDYASGAPIGEVIRLATVEGYEVKRALALGEAVEEGAAEVELPRRRGGRRRKVVVEGRIVVVGGRRYLVVGSPYDYFAIFSERPVKRTGGLKEALLENWGLGRRVAVCAEVERVKGERGLRTSLAVRIVRRVPRAELEVWWVEDPLRPAWPMRGCASLPPPTADTAALIEVLLRRVIQALRGYYSAERVEAAVEYFIKALERGYREVEVEEKSCRRQLFGHEYTAVVRAKVDEIP